MIPLKSPNAHLFRRTAFTLLLSGLMTTQAFALGGTVKNGASTGIKGVRVSLVSDTSIKARTDSSGSFTLNTTTGVFRVVDRSNMTQSVDHIVVREGRLRFSLSSLVREGVVSIFTLDGTKRFESPRFFLEAGAHEMNIPELSSGLYSLRFTLDGQSTVMQMILPRFSAQTIGSPVARSTGSETRTALARTADSPLPVIDTLLVKRVGYATSKVPIVTYTQTDVAIIIAPDTVSQLAPITDYSANGPYATVVEASVGPNNAYTIIRPETLGANGFKHAPIIYGHGISSQVSTFTTFLRSVASHGFVIIACNVLTGGPNAVGNTNAMNNGLNWILAQDTTTGSIYKGKLATDRASSMGYSVGGTAAVDIGGHPSLQTVVSIHGHISTATLNGTLLQTSGTLDNVGLPMQQQTYTNSAVQTFLGTVTGANHGYIQNNNGGVQRAAIIAWLRYWIYNDQGGKNYFYGSTCVMCTAPWENPQRKYWN